MAGRRDLIKMTDEEIDAFLHGPRVVNIATYNHDGTIHLVAMWYGFVNGNVAFETFSKSQKVLNLQRDDRITCLVEAGESYDQLQGVEIVGRAKLTDDWEGVLELATQIATRYYGVTNPDDAKAIAEAVAKKRTLIEIVPDKIVSWDHTKLGGTY